MTAHPFIASGCYQTGLKFSLLPPDISSPGVKSQQKDMVNVTPPR